jgi:hypothetical protein
MVPAVRPVGAIGGANVMISDSTLDGADVPTAFIVDTRKLYMVLGVSSVTVKLLPVIKVSMWYRVPQLEPASSENSMRASVAVVVLVQLSTTVVDVMVPADRSIGASGAANVIIPDSTVDGADVPSAFIVDTRKLYVVEGVKYVTVAEPSVIKSPVWSHVFQVVPELSE